MGSSASNGGSSRAAVEAPNTLISNTRIKLVDLIGEGVHGGFWQHSGISGSNPLCSVYLDGTPILNPDGSPNYNISGQGFAFAYMSGTSGQTGMAGFTTVEAMVPLPVNTRVSNPPAGKGYPQMVVTAFNTSMYPDAEGVKVTTRVPALYTVNTQNGDTNQFSLFYDISISLNGGEWVPQILGPDGNGDPSTVYEMKGKCTSPYYKTHVLPLPKTAPPATSYSWRVRVRRLDLNVMSNSTANDLFVDGISVISSNTFRYPMSAMVGLEMTANQFGTIPTRAYDVKGIQVLVPEGYTPTAYNTDGTITPAVYPTPIWNGTWGERKWTDNPAFVFYDLCTNKRYGLGNYVRQEWLDKWTIYQIAQECDEMVDDGNGGLEPQFTCNVAIQTPQDAYTLLNNLVSVFRGMLYWANGRVFPVGPETRDSALNFTNANVVGGTFTYADTPRNTRSTVCTVRWSDPDNLFRSTPERVEDPDGIARYGIIEKQITAFACISRGQAIRTANWILTAEQQLTETIRFQADLEGVYLRPGDVVNVYDNLRNDQQQGGRIAGFNSARDTITLDKEVTLHPAFTYYMAASVPATNIADASGITGSNQISLIRAPQIETRQVTTSAGTGLTTLTVDSPFGANLYRGSIWLLNASGTSVTVFDQSTQYKVLTLGEPQPGRVDVFAVEYQTGINYLVNNNYSSEIYPPIVGDTTPPLAPTGLQASRVTGLLNDNTFFSYAYIDWIGRQPEKTAYYDVSGKLGTGPWFSIGKPTTTGVQYVPDSAGLYTFSVAAFNANGYGSAYNSGTYTEPGTNPFGNTAPLSGIIIAQNADPYTFSVALNRATGYVGLQPTLQWDIALDQIDDALESPSAQFVTGYQVRFKSLADGTTDLLPNPFILEGKDNNTLTWDERFLYTGTNVKPLRAFIVDVQTMDAFGGTASGARLAINNPQPRPPIASGFVGFNGGMTYNITPAREADISGVMIWTNALPSFVPTFDNRTYVSSNLAGFAPGPSAGSIYTWFALVDSYGPSGSMASNGDYNTRIYGPISGNADQMFGTFALSIDTQINQALNDISGAFSLLTGQVTNSINIVSGQNQLTLQTVNGLSGQVMGTTPGDANTALNVRVNTAVATSSGSLSQQINAVSARLETTGSNLNATVGQVSTALTNSGIALGSQINVVQANLNTTNSRLTATGATLLSAMATSDGALASWITNLGVQTTGASAAVRIGAEALVTGSVNGLGGAAVARWGFELDANGKIASMKATVNSFASYGVAVFGNLDLQSDTFAAGSAGWRIQADGDVEFNNGMFRGDFTGGAGTSITTINADGFKVGSVAGGSYAQIQSTSATKSLSFVYGGAVRASIGATNFGGLFGGDVSLYNNAGALTMLHNGQEGLTQYTSYGTVGHNSDGRFQIAGSSTVSIALATNSSQRWLIGGSDGNIKAVGAYNIQKLTSDGWSVPLWDGSNSIEFRWDGALQARIDGTTVLTITTT